MRAINIDQKAKEEFLKAIIAEATTQLNLTRGIPEIKINKKFTNATVKPETNAIINFSAIAWLKIRTQVTNSKEECAWHGIVEANEERTVFNITDILVYPQRIAGVTVEDDDPLYEVWHQNLDTYTYNHLRMQGHSHIEMHAAPSGRDTTTYENVLQALSNNSFYIFMITNKQGNVWFNIYDLLHNRVWEQNDIDVTIENMDMYGWFKDISDTYYAKKSTTFNKGEVSTSKAASDVSKKSKTFLGKTLPTLEELKEKQKQQAEHEINPYNIYFSEENLDAFFSASDTVSDRRLYGGGLRSR